MLNYFDVLKAQSGIPVDDIWAEIWGRGLQGGYKIIEYTGFLPITITANGDALLDYRIYGASGGVGVATENLFDGQGTDNYGYYNNDNGLYVNSKNYKYWRFPVKEGDVIRWTTTGAGYGCCFSNGVYKGKFTTYMTPFTVPADVDEVTNNFDSSVWDSAMVTKNQPLPATYVPYGYKLPMTVYKQEFTVTNDMLDQSNWVLSGYWFIYFDISDFISKEECDVKIYENFADGYTPKLLVVAITNKEYSMVDDSYRILKNDGEILNKKFDFSSWNKIYLCIGYGNGYSGDNIKQLKIDELFGNWKILVAPTSQTQEPPVYIGENQLDGVEGIADYVDKSSGKIVRMIGEYTFTGDENFNKYGSSDVFYTSKTIDPVGITTVNTTTMRCDHPAFTAIENKDTRYWLNPEADDICCFLPGGMSQVFLRSTSNFTTATECKAYLKAQYDNGTPVKISYWLKTPVEEDPPVPLPEIPTIDGTTVIDYDGTPKPSQMYVKYKERR